MPTPAVYANYIKILIALCQRRGFKLRKIGTVGNKKEYPIFALSFNNKVKADKTACLVGGLHGEEPAGPLALLKFLQNFRPKKYSKTKIIIVPVANPSGFDRGVRRNFLGWDINRHFFDKKSTAENKIICDFLKNEKIDILHTLHEDYERKKFYLWIFERQNSGIARKIIKLAKRFFLIDKRTKLEGFTAKDGSITYLLNRKIRTMTSEGSLENWAFRRGTPLVLATETPIKTELSKRMGFYIKLMNFLLKQQN